MKARGLGRVYQRGRIWWIQYSFRGRRRRESSRSARRTDAVKLLRRRQGEMGQGRLVGPDVERTTYEDLVEMIENDYRIKQRKSGKRLHSSTSRLGEYFGGWRALDITADRVAAYTRWRQEGFSPQPAPATLCNELAALKRMFTLGIRTGKVAQRPYIQMPKARNIRQGFFEESEFRSVINHLPSYLKPLLEFAYHTGWRIGEIILLEWWQVDFNAGTVRLEPGTTKNDEGRTYPFTANPRLADLVRQQRVTTDALERSTGNIIPRVFHRQGKPIKDFRYAWSKACRTAGVPGRLVHDLRRTAVRNLERAAVPRSVAMKLTGHLTEAVYRRYAIASEADLTEGVRKLASLPREIATVASGRVHPFAESGRGRKGTEGAQSGVRERKVRVARKRLTTHKHWCRGRDLNPDGELTPRDFKSPASASFATPASW